MCTVSVLLFSPLALLGCIAHDVTVLESRRDRKAYLVQGHKLQMAAGKVAHATLKGPSVVKEICIGFALGLIAGGFWKMHHWNEQRKVRTFYDMLEKGQISVVVEE